MASILKVDTIQDQSGNNIINESADTITIGASGDTITVPTGATLTVPNGGLSGQNYPAFEAYLSANIVVTNNIVAKIPINTEVFDTNGYYDNATNYRFTPLVAGKYVVYASAYGFADSANNLESVRIYIHKNGSIYRGTYFSNTTNGSYSKTPYVHAVIDMDGSTDYLEAYALVESINNNNPRILSNATDKSTCFGAYRIGA